MISSPIYSSLCAEVVEFQFSANTVYFLHGITSTPTDLAADSYFHLSSNVLNRAMSAVFYVEPSGHTIIT